MLTECTHIRECHTSQATSQYNPWSTRPCHKTETQHFQRTVNFLSAVTYLQFPVHVCIIHHSATTGLPMFTLPFQSISKPNPNFDFRPWPSNMTERIQVNQNAKYLGQSDFIQMFLSGLVLFLLPSVLWHCWLGGRKGIQPVKYWAVGCWHGYLSGARCRLASGPADATATLSLASVKSRLVLPFWYRLTRVVPDKGPSNGCVCVFLSGHTHTHMGPST